MRYLSPYINQILKKKMVFVGGPRQSGKTTLAKTFINNQDAYLNWDFDIDRERILKNNIPLQFPLLILDEIHKYPRWRNWLKGYYDKYSPRIKFLITGSAKLDLYRRGGDSLQGRYRYLRLYPFSFKETNSNAEKIIHELMSYSGFPEPFLAKSETESRIWSREYRTRLIKEDLVDLENIQNTAIFEKLLLLLPERVGSPLSINSLREDLSVAHDTISRWLEIYERLYGIFRIYPFQNTKLKSLKKESKHYHFDWTLVEDKGARFENLIAFHLLKHVHFLQDTKGIDINLYYFRDIEKREIDFVIVQDKKPLAFIEAKISDTKPTTSLNYIRQKFPNARIIQVLLENDLHSDYRGIEIMGAKKFLSELSV